MLLLAHPTVAFTGATEISLPEAFRSAGLKPKKSCSLFCEVAGVLPKSLHCLVFLALCILSARAQTWLDAFVALQNRDNATSR